ncbi:MAG: sulfite exporter TauE/SafE family protein [Chloroflexi bacterium]|nr:sulfite exporter TauE/SafE family protein [Chloroflexota bacterium]
MIPPEQFLLIFAVTVAAGAINALAGGGTLLTFPLLMAVGLPSVSANVTNQIALMPGFFGAALAQIKDLKGQEKRLMLTLPVSVLGGLLGGWLLIRSGERLFNDIVPFLILIASLLLAAQDTIRRWLMRRSEAGHIHLTDAWVVIPVFLATIYGGYFGAAASIIVLAVTGLGLEDTLTRLNAIKQVIGLVSGTAAAVFFAFTGQINWPVALVMMAGSLLGGLLGGRVAGKVNAGVLRWVIVTVGLALAVVYFVK